MVLHLAVPLLSSSATDRSALFCMVSVTSVGETKEQNGHAHSKICSIKKQSVFEARYPHSTLEAVL